MASNKLSEQSIITYTNQLKNIIYWKSDIDKKRIDISKIKEDEFNNFDEIYNLIKSHTNSTSSQKTALSAVLSFLRGFKKSSDPKSDSSLAKKYAEKIQELNGTITDNKSKNI